MKRIKGFLKNKINSYLEGNKDKFGLAFIKLGNLTILT